MCEAQADLALHGNKVSLPSDTSVFAPLLPFYGFCILLITAGVAFRATVPADVQKAFTQLLLCLEQNCGSVAYWQCRIASGQIFHMSLIHS